MRNSLCCSHKARLCRGCAPCRGSAACSVFPAADSSSLDAAPRLRACKRPREVSPSPGVMLSSSHTCLKRYWNIKNKMQSWKMKRLPLPLVKGKLELVFRGRKAHFLALCLKLCLHQLCNMSSGSGFHKLFS